MQPVDVVVVTYNSQRVVTRLLDSIAGACGALPFRTVVVDNGSSDATVGLVSSRDDVLVVERANLGFGAGVNAGVDALDGSGPILVLNPDVQLGEGAVEELYDVLTARAAGVTVPVLRGSDGVVARSLRREPTLLRTVGLGDSRYPLLSEVVNEEETYRSIGPTDWATGAVMLLDRSCYTRLGGFDELFFMYSEETDFCLRARDAGFPTYVVPEAVALHVGGDSGRNPDLYAMQVLNRVRLHRRRHNLPSTSLLFALTAGRELVHAARGHQDSRRAVSALLLGRRPELLHWSGSPLRRSMPRRVVQ